MSSDTIRAFWNMEFFISSEVIYLIWIENFFISLYLDST